MRTPILLSLLCAAGSAFALPNPDTRFRPGANHHLGDDSFLAKHERTPGEGDTEKARMKVHLEHIRSLLASRAATKPELAGRRAEILGYLDDYIARGITPTNAHLPWRAPVFIDDGGAICAVGYLIERSVGRALPERIAKQHRYEFLEDIVAAMPDHGLYDLPQLQRSIAGPVGIDAYTSRSGLRELRRRGLAMTGQASPIPLVLEAGCGFFPWFPALAKDDQTLERDQLLTLLATGARGFNLYMAVERDRWYGAAISATGTVEPHAAWIKPLIRALDEIDWPSLRRATAIALVDTRADARFGIATSLADPLTPVLAEILDFGPGGAAELGTDADAIAARRWQTAITAALELAQVPYEIVSESATVDHLARYRAVIAPTLDRVDRALWTTLRELAEAKRGIASLGSAEARSDAQRRGGTIASLGSAEARSDAQRRGDTIVVIGPGTPTRDELDRPLADPAPKRIGRLKQGSLDDVPGLAADLGALAGDLPDSADAWQIERPDDVRAHAFADAEGKVRAVFVLSDAAVARTAMLLVPPNVRLRDPFSAEGVVPANGRASIAVPPRGVRMYLVD